MLLATNNNPVSFVPDDVASLQKLVRELRSQVHIEQLARERAEYRVKDLLRRLFGPKSEKLDPNQYLLAIEQVDADQALALSTQPVAAPPAALPGSQPTPKRKGGGRRAAPANLPVETTLIDLPEEQKAGLVKIREEITEEQEYRPSQFYVHRIVRPVYVRASGQSPCAARGRLAGAGHPAVRCRSGPAGTPAGEQIRRSSAAESHRADRRACRHRAASAEAMPVGGELRAPAACDP
jgi:hypothetical protein